MTPPERLTLRTIAQDFVRDFSQAEKGLWGTIVQLTVRPRRVIDTFLFKDRNRFSRPTRYLIFCLSMLAIQSLAKEWRYGDDTSMTLAAQPGAVETVEAEGPVSAFAQGFANGGGEVNPDKVRALATYTGYLLAAMIPLFAFLYYFFFPGRRFNYAESLAAATYLHSHWILLLSLVSFVLLLLPNYAHYVEVRNWTKIGAIIFLAFIVLRTFLSSRRGTPGLLLRLFLGLPWLVCPTIVLGLVISFFIAVPEASTAVVPPYGIFLIVFAGGVLASWGFGRSLLSFRHGWPGWWRGLPILVLAAGLWGMFAYGVVIAAGAG